MKQMKVAVLVGSLRRNSYSKMMAKVLQELAPATLDLQLIELGNLPLYNQDFDDDGNPPESYTTFRNTMKTMDAVLFITPEYNRSTTPALKNALDVGSRPYGASVWDGKPGAIMSVTPGALGAFGANHHLRQSLVFLNVPTMAQPEAYVSSVHQLFDDQGKLVKEGTKKFLTAFLEAFATWVEKNR